MSNWSEDIATLPGPVGVKYDDSMTMLRVHLVVMGIKERTMVRAANTDVHLKYDDESFSILLEVFKMNKKMKPPMKIVLERRFFEMQKCPGKILSIDYKLKKDQCILSASHFLVVDPLMIALPVAGDIDVRERTPRLPEIRNDAFHPQHFSSLQLSTRLMGS